MIRSFDPAPARRVLILCSTIALLVVATTAEAQIDGDAGRGAEQYRACVSCHSLEPGSHLTGPSLADLWGRPAGQADGFIRYSQGLSSADITWDEDTLNTDSVLLGLRALFRPGAAPGLTAGYELRIRELVVHALIHEGTLQAGEGPLEDPDLVLETDFALRALLTGELTLDEALESRKLRLVGDRDLLEPFVETFRITPTPAGAAS